MLSDSKLKDTLTNEFLNYILIKFPLYKRTYEYIIQNMNDKYLEYAEKICYLILKKNHNNKNKCLLALDNFIKYSYEYLQLQVHLMKNGSYLYATEKELEEKVYSKEIMDNYYLDGLFLSQVFWVNHYKIMVFFMNTFLSKLEDKKKILDIPCGTGIFSMALKELKKSCNIDLVDINSSSLTYSREILGLSNNLTNCNFIKRNIYKIDTMGKYDAIICGELLEHVEHPLKVLEILANVLKNDGIIFVTTVVFCAAIDHIYLFKNMQEIRDLIQKTELKIIEEYILPLSLKEYNQQKNKEPLNVALILKKK